jgi:hypothetical protein
MLIEDDPQQSQSIIAAVERHCEGAGVKVELVETEADFYSRVSGMRREGTRPCMVVSDMMLPWAHPKPDAPKPPPEVVEGTFHKAGSRCWSEFRKWEDLRAIPWIYFTVLDGKTIEFERYSDDQTHYARKGSSIEPLLEKVEERLLDAVWEESDEQVTQSLTAPPRMRGILLAGLKAPLEDCTASLP